MSENTAGKVGIQRKKEEALRLVTFNVNGIKTLKNYAPWHDMADFNAMLNHMDADVITFQELKMQPGDVNQAIAHMKNYRTFLSVPKAKKGYSGVGVFVRIPEEKDNAKTRRLLNVLRAEEGISGELNVPGLSVTYKEAYKSEDLGVNALAIGGYPESTLLSREFGLQIDSEGRCVIVELDNNLVIISVYCPANSMATEEGELFRVSFLRCLFERARNLKALGKNVVIMGDINVARDLIDNDEYIRHGLRDGVLRAPAKMEGEIFEKLNAEEVEEFRTATEPRAELHSILVEEDETRRKILHDVVRKFQGRRLKMYTCWNTLKNMRPQNMGSRIDLILATTALQNATLDAGIWPHLMGSDHCPVYADFDVTKLDMEETLAVVKPSRMEAKYVFKVPQARSIASFFGSRSTSSEDSAPVEKTSEESESPELPVSVTSVKATAVKRKLVAPPPVKKQKTNGQPSIQSFFKK